MFNLLSLLQTPESLNYDNTNRGGNWEDSSKIFKRYEIQNWFDTIASVLLNNYFLVVNNIYKYRILEIEFYYFASNHPDIFAHQNPLQKSCGYWYFHRQGEKSYKNGSFKGLDITFGNRESYGGILIRSLESEEGKLIIGPSLCVDALLSQTNSKSIGELDRTVENIHIWDTSSAVRLEEKSIITNYENRNQENINNQIFFSARVGLSLKKLQFISEKQQYILLPYRYLIEPKKIRKGKLHLVISLYIQGDNVDKIHFITGSPKRTITKYIQDFEAGKQEIDFSRYVGANLSPQELSRLHGTWYKYNSSFTTQNL